MKKLLELRNEMKKKKPTFLRQEAHKRKKLGKKWLRPKGRDSKMRRKMRGYRRTPSVGYASPRKVKGLTRDGFIERVVETMKDLKNISKEEIIILSRRLGLKKKILLLKEIEKQGLKVGNVEDIPKFLKDVDEKFKTKKKESKEKEEHKKKSKEDSLKKAEEKKKEEEKKTEEEKEKEEKEEEKKIKKQMATQQAVDAGASKK